MVLENNTGVEFVLNVLLTEERGRAAWRIPPLVCAHFSPKQRDYTQRSPLALQGDAANGWQKGRALRIPSVLSQHDKKELLFREHLFSF